MFSLSTSSSKHSTLKVGSWTPSRAVVACVTLFILVNIAVASLAAEGLLVAGLPLKIISEFSDQTKQPSDVWLIGNSTLARSIVKDQLEEATAKQTIRMELGSGTLSAQVALAKFCLIHTTERPQRLFFFATKDDFNLNGARHETSKTYHRVIGEPTLSDRLGELVPLYVYRTSIRQQCREAVFGLKRRIVSLLREKKTPAPAKVSREKKAGKAENLSMESQLGYLSELGASYKFDSESLQQLIKLNKDFPEIEVALVFPPVTKAIQDWQEKYAPDANWDDLRGRIRQKLDSHGIEFHDFSMLLPSTTEFFRDVYHLNSNGAYEFTETFIGIVGRETIDQTD